jgi:hypothetical protein
MHRPDPPRTLEPRDTVRIIAMQNIVPVLATVAAFLLFRFVPSL